MNDDARRGTPPKDARAVEVQELVVVVGERLQRRSDGIVASMDAAIESVVEDLGESELTDMLRASVEAMSPRSCT